MVVSGDEVFVLCWENPCTASGWHMLRWLVQTWFRDQTRGFHFWSMSFYMDMCHGPPATHSVGPQANWGDWEEGLLTETPLRAGRISTTPWACVYPKTSKRSILGSACLPGPAGLAAAEGVKEIQTAAHLWSYSIGQGCILLFVSDQVRRLTTQMFTCGNVCFNCMGWNQGFLLPPQQVKEVEDFLWAYQSPASLGRWRNNVAHHFDQTCAPHIPPPWNSSFLSCLSSYEPAILVR